MGDPNSCACGAHPTDPDGVVTFITDTLIDAVLGGVAGKLKYLGVVAPFVGNVVNVGLICSLPKPAQPEWELSDFANPQTALNKAAQMLYSKIYELNCTCNDCPPVAGCGSGGEPIIVGPENGYRIFPEENEIRYWQTSGAPIAYIERADATCYGPFDGVAITWHLNGVFDPSNGVSVCHEDGTHCQSWSQNSISGTVTIHLGGSNDKPIEPIPEPPDGVDDWYGPAPCTDSDICVVLDDIAERVRRVEFLTTVIAGPLFGVTASYTGTFPGISTPIVGQLNDWLPRALAAVAPVQPSQLVSPDVTPITGSSLVELDGEAYAVLELTTVPDYLGYRGEGDSQVYHFNAPRFAAGWLLVIGQEGVLANYDIRYGAGLEFPIPSTATALALHLSAGVEVSLTTYGRAV